MEKPWAVKGSAHTLGYGVKVAPDNLAIKVGVQFLVPQPTFRKAEALKHKSLPLYFISSYKIPSRLRGPEGFYETFEL